MTSSIILVGYLFYVALAYICGSMPFGYWFGKWAKGPHFDIRDHGSGNIGFTNVKRVLGWKVALPVLIFDIGKGLLPTLLGKATHGEILATVCMLAAATGHAFSLYFY